MPPPYNTSRLEIYFINCVRSYIDASSAFEKLRRPRNSSIDSLLSKHPSTTSTGSKDSMTMCSQGARPTSAIFSRMKRMQNQRKR